MKRIAPQKTPEGENEIPLSGVFLGETGDHLFHPEKMIPRKSVA